MEPTSLSKESLNAEMPAHSSLAKLAFLLAVLAIAACAVFGLAGCKPPEGQLAANAAIAEMAAVENRNAGSLEFLTEVSQAQQLEQIGISNQELFDWWLEGFAYSLGDLEMNIEEDEAVIEAKITCRQLEPIIKTWSNEYVEWLVTNQDAIKQGAEDPCAYGRDLLRGLFEATEPTLVETTLTVRKYDDNWSVVGEASNGVYADALLGSTDNLAGYYSAPLDELRALGIKLPVSYQIDINQEELQE